MKKEPSSFDLSPEKLAQLWSVGSDIDQGDGAVSHEQRKAELLRDWLATTLPLDQTAVKSRPGIGSHVREHLMPFAGDSIDSLLRDPQTAVLTFKKIKGSSKKVVEAAESEVEHDAAVVIYYAAIASALVFHGRRITTFSYADLADSFSTLLEDNWLTPNLVRLLKKAHRLCQQKAGGKTGSA